MERFKRTWFRIPSSIRKPFVLVIGMALVIISPFTGVLPGPGGIPIFLIGVAILSTEFEWAQRLRDWTLVQVHRLGHVWKAHKIIGTIFILICIAVAVALSMLAYRWMRTTL